MENELNLNSEAPIFDTSKIVSVDIAQVALLRPHTEQVSHRNKQVLSDYNNAKGAK